MAINTPRKIKLMVADLPTLPEQQLAIFCRQCEDMLINRLDYNQLAHLRAFPMYGEALKARTSRVLARLVALGSLPVGTIIGMDNADRPTLKDDNRFCLAFSHCDGKAFAAFANKRNVCENFCLAIDAEACSNNFNVEAMRYFLGRICPEDSFAHYIKALRFEDVLRLWLLYECSVKLSANDFGEFILSAKACCEFPRKGSFLYKDMIINWQISCFSDFLICVASTGHGLPEIEFVLYTPGAGIFAHA